MRGVSMQALVRQLIHGRREASERHATLADAFRRYFEPEHGGKRRENRSNTRSLVCAGLASCILRATVFARRLSIAPSFIHQGPSHSRRHGAQAVQGTAAVRLKLGEILRSELVGPVLQGIAHGPSRPELRLWHFVLADC